MGKTTFIGNVLRDDQWNNCTAGCDTLDEAIDLVKAHFKMQPSKDAMGAAIRNDPNLEFRIYRSEDSTWNPTIVEVGLNDKTPMMALAVYKIIQAQFAN